MVSRPRRILRRLGERGQSLFLRRGQVVLLVLAVHVHKIDAVRFGNVKSDHSDAAALSFTTGLDPRNAFSEVRRIPASPIRVLDFPRSRFARLDKHRRPSGFSAAW
jgi:hypothetical protein